MGETKEYRLEDEPLGRVEARQLVRKILRSPSGQVVFTRHALEESMTERGITEAEAISCLSRGFCGERITFERGTWRYPIEVPELVVVVAFDSETLAIIITAWRRT